MTNPLQIRKIAVLGSGVMGAQIAAHFINAGIEALLFDLPTPQADNMNSLALSSIQNLIKLKPAPLTIPENARYLQACNYAQDLNRLKECDLIIEAISERLDLKENLYKEISPYINPNTILASNTSGLSINQLASVIPEKHRAHFWGVHFFNPPRYMTLVELIPNIDSDLKLMEKLEAFLVSVLGKGIVYSKDTPNFVGNRIGIFSMLITMYHAEKFNLGFDVVDALTGPLIGRPKSATFRTADVVGLDTFAHAVHTMTVGLSKDPWHQYFVLPNWLNTMIQNGSLGQKSGKGIYKKQDGQILVYDVTKNDYRPATGEVDEEIKTIFAARDFTKILSALHDSKNPQAQFLWSCFRDVFHYSAYFIQDITSTVRDLDCALRWGFGWQQGPFELWQRAGWESIGNWIQQDIEAGKTLSSAALPKWVSTLKEVFTAEGAFSPETNSFLPRRPLQVYQRQLYPDPVLAEVPLVQHTVFENDGVRLWHTGDEMAVMSFKTKLGTIDNTVIDGIRASIEVATRLGQGLILWNNTEYFSAGANLKGILASMQAKDFSSIEKLLENFQKISLELRYCSTPTVAAFRGFAIGGGCELILHCSTVIAALESTIGLVETSVGLIPAGGGCAAMILRAWETLPENPYPLLEKYYLQITQGLRTENAALAKRAHYLRSTDKITFNPYELLFLAKATVKQSLIDNYHPPLRPPVGFYCNTDYQEKLFNAWQTTQGEKASAHDALLAKQLSFLFGKPVTENAPDIETELHRREREVFALVAQTEATEARIDSMLKTGKPLRN